MYNFRHYLYFDNFYLTKSLYDYSDEMVKLGIGESILPLQLYERVLYVHRLDSWLTPEEASREIIPFLIDLIIVLIAIILFICDYGMVWYVNLTRKVSKYMLNVIVPQDPDLFKKIDNNSIVNLDKFLKNFKRFRQNIQTCFPSPSPIEWDLYQKLFFYIVALFIFKQIIPFIKRSRSYLCEKIHPELLRPRAMFLYNKIIFNRLFIDTM